MLPRPDSIMPYVCDFLRFRLKSADCRQGLSGGTIIIEYLQCLDRPIPLAHWVCNNNNAGTSSVVFVRT